MAGSSPAVGKTLADPDVFGIVKAVTPTTVVISHITTGRAITKDTLTYNIVGTSLSAQDHWVLEKDYVLSGMLKNPFWKKLIKLSPTATGLLSSLLNPATPKDQSKAWVNKWGSVSVSYLLPGDLVYGVSAVSEAKTAQDELAGTPVPLATLQDEVDHVPAPPATLAEKLQAKLFALALAF